MNNLTFKNRLRFMLMMFILACPGLIAAQTPTQQIESLISNGQLSQALVLVERGLSENSNDVNFLFLKGLILTRQNQLEKAKQIFIGLTNDHPELPEPFNNLAVIYAAEGNYDSAMEALQRAINTHPSYATAHENLGDIYAKMASRAYNLALELDEENATAREKLLLVDDLFSTRQADDQELAERTQREQQLTAELARLERELSQAEQQSQQELQKVAETRKELSNLQTQRSAVVEDLEQRKRDAEQETSQISDRIKAAREELATLQQQAKASVDKATREQTAAEAQSRSARQDLEKVTMELKALQQQHDAYVTQSESEQSQLERRKNAVASELAGLENRKQELERTLNNQASSAGNEVKAAREELGKIQSQIADLERERVQKTVQAREESEQLQSQVSTTREELERLRSELSGLREQRAELVAANTINQAASLNSGSTAISLPETPAQARPPEQQLFDALDSWAEKWSAKDVEGYLAAYSPAFKPPDGMSRSAWAAQRRDRIRSPRYIRVGVENIRVRYIGDEHAQVVFDQSYRSDSYRDKVEKTLLMQYTGGQWLIAEEDSK